MQIDEEALFHAARAVPPGASRDDLLAEACAGDEPLLRRLQGLLRIYQASAAVDETTGLGAHDTSILTSPLPAAFPRIASYDIQEQIGEGGFGYVFRAEQKQPFKRLVAIKVLRPGMDSREVLARFDAERQALALMSHPHIARVFDAGVTDEGRPYFAMEFVDGRPITRYCDQARLTLRQRLELFATVCQAVQHAHQKGIIHRDLKPGNVLVALNDGAAVPKVIDFGIAKAISQPLTEHSIHTRAMQLIGTPLYMSPEQAEAGALDIDTRSDIYSLGVLLYELLTGQTPFDKQTLQAAGDAGMRRIICEEEPPAPSQKVSTLHGDPLTTASRQRGVDERRLSQLLKGELDWIVLKALEKDPNRRYESASALAADVQRYLNHEPVEASPPSSWYRAKKYVVRNRALLVTTAVIALALLTGTGVSLWQAWEANAARFAADRAATAKGEALTLATQRFDEAEAERKIAAASFQKARETVKKLLAQVATDEVVRIPGMRDVYLKLIEEAIASYDELIELKPDDAEIYADQGQLYFIKGDLTAAQAKYQQAVELSPMDSRLHLGLAEALMTATVATTETRNPQNSGSGIHYSARDPGRGDDASLTRALEHAERAVALNPDQDVSARLMLAKILYRLDHSERAQNELSQVEQRGPFSTQQLGALADVCNGLREFKRGIEYSQQALAIDPNNHQAHFRLGESHLLAENDEQAMAALNESLRLDPLVNHGDRLNKLQMRGDTYIALGKHADALADFNEVLQLEPQRWIVYKRRALAHFYLSRFAEALADLKRGLELNPSDASLISWISPSLAARCPDAEFVGGVFSLAASHPRKLKDLHLERASHRLDSGDADGALQDVLQAAELDPDGTSVGNHDAVKQMIKRGGPYHGKLLPLRERYLAHEQAEIVRLKASFEEHYSLHGGTSPTTRSLFTSLSHARQLYGSQLIKEHRATEAQQVMLAALNDCRRVWGEDNFDTLILQGNLATTYVAQGEYDQAEGPTVSTFEAARRTLGDEHVFTLVCWGNLGQLRIEQRRFDEAEEQLLQAYEICSRVRGEKDGYTLKNASRLAMVYGEKGEYTRAEELLLKQLEISRVAFGEESGHFAAMLWGLVSSYEKSRDYTKLEPFARRHYGLQQRRRQRPYHVFDAESRLGSSLLGQNKLEEAEPLILAGYAGMMANQEPGRIFAEDLVDATQRVVRLYEAKNDWEQIVYWQYELEAARQRWPPPREPGTP